MWDHLFLPGETPLILYNANLLMKNFIVLCLSEVIIISPSLWQGVFWVSMPLSSVLNIMCREISWQSTIASLKVIFIFSLAAFKIFFLSHFYKVLLWCTCIWIFYLPLLARSGSEWDDDPLRAHHLRTHSISGPRKYAFFPALLTGVPWTF